MPASFTPGSISGRFSVAMFVLVLLAGGSMLTAGYHGLAARHEEQSSRERDLAVTRAAEVLADPLQRGDMHRVERLCVAFSNEPRIVEFRLEDSRSKVLFASRASGSARDDTIREERSVLSEGHVLGVLSVRFSADGHWMRSAFFISYVLPFLAFAAMLLAAVPLLARRMVHHPFRALSARLESLSRGEPFPAVYDAAELQPLVAAFDRLREDIVLRESELRGLGEEIATLHETESGLRDSLFHCRNSLHLFIYNATDGYWDWDPAKETLYLSPRWKAQLGYADAEFPNSLEAWFALVAPADSLRTHALITECLTGERDSIEFQYAMRHRDGSWKTLYLRGSVQKDADGVPIRAAGIHADGSDRKKQEEHLWLSRKTLEEILDALPAGIAVIGSDSLIKRWNSAAVRLSGIGRNEALGKDIARLIPEFTLFSHKASRGGADAIHPILKRVHVRHGERVAAYDSAAMHVHYMGSDCALVFFMDAGEQEALENALVHAAGVPEKDGNSAAREWISVPWLVAEALEALQNSEPELFSSYGFEQEYAPDLPEIFCRRREMVCALGILLANGTGGHAHTVPPRVSARRTENEVYILITPKDHPAPDGLSFSAGVHLGESLEIFAARYIIERRHDGVLASRSEPGRATEFLLRLPAMAGVASAPSSFQSPLLE